MGRPRLPSGTKRTPDSDARRLKQANALSEIERLLEEHGLTDGHIRAIARAYRERRAGAGLIAKVEDEFKERRRILQKLAKEAEATHALLHQLFGRAEQLIDLRASPQPHRKERPARGGWTRRADSFRGESCNLADSCDASYPEIRDHAAFCRFLRGHLKGARRHTDRTGIRDEIEAHAPELKEKGAIVAFLVEDVRIRSANRVPDSVVTLA